MYFGFGPFGFGVNPPRQQNPYRQQQPPRQPQQQHNNGFFGGLANFVADNFMNPFAQQPPPPPRQPQPRPSFHRRPSKTEERPTSAPKTSQTYDQNTGMYWKIKGNQAFQHKRYDVAIQLYSKAIELNNTQSVFFSNRAMCFKKLGHLNEAFKDAQEAVELDPDNIKAHLISGQLLAEFGKQENNLHKVENAIKRLTKALTLSGTKKSLQKEISRYIYLAKKLGFYLKFNEIRNARIAAINQYKNYLDKDTTMDVATKDKKMQDFLNASNENVVFSIPEYLTCRITLDLMQDPVVTDCGQTYERQAIELHIQKNGKTDPFTRQPIKGPLYPCVSIKKAIQEFLDHNPWAYEYNEGQSYKDIMF